MAFLATIPKNLSSFLCCNFFVNNDIVFYTSIMETVAHSKFFMNSTDIVAALLKNRRWISSKISFMSSSRSIYLYKTLEQSSPRDLK